VHSTPSARVVRALRRPRCAAAARPGPWHVGRSPSLGDGRFGGLASGGTYFVIKVDDHTLKLAKTLANAVAPAPVAINLTVAGAGTSHRLQTLKPTIDALALAGALAGAGGSDESGRRKRPRWAVRRPESSA